MKRLLYHLRMLYPLFVTTAILFIRQPFLVSLVSILILLAIYLFRPDAVLKRLKILALIGFSIIIFNLLFNRTIPLDMRVITGIVQALKIITLSSIVFFYTSTTSPVLLVRWLQFLPESIVLMLVITFSFIPVISLDYEQIRLVQKSRGLHGGWNIILSLFPVLIPLLHQTLRRAEELAVVLVSRGYEV